MKIERRNKEVISFQNLKINAIQSFLKPLKDPNKYQIQTENSIFLLELQDYQRSA